jgi:hypothetical protein
VGKGWRSLHPKVKIKFVLNFPRPEERFGSDRRATTDREALLNELAISKPSNF